MAILISHQDYEKRYVDNGSEIMILNSPVVTTDLLMAIKKLKRVYVIENNLYEHFDKAGVAAFIEAISSFDFKLFHVCAGIVSLKIRH